MIRCSLGLLIWFIAIFKAFSTANLNYGSKIGKNGVWDFIDFSKIVQYGNFFIALFFSVRIDEKNGTKTLGEKGRVHPENGS